MAFNAFGFGSFNHDLGTRLGLLIAVLNSAMQSRHRWDAGRRRVMDEHGDIKIACREHLSHVRKVHPNVVTGGVVLRIIHVDVDRPAMLQQDEMVRCVVV